MSHLQTLFQFIESLLAIAAPGFIIWALSNESYRSELTIAKILVLAGAFILYVSLGSVIETAKDWIGMENRAAIEIADGFLFLHFITVIVAIVVLGLFSIPYLVLVGASFVQNFSSYFDSVSSLINI